MDLYGSDKPDLRAGPPIVDLAGVFAGTAFKAFAATLDAGGTVRGWRFRGGGDLTRNRLDGLIERAQHLGEGPRLDGRRGRRATACPRRQVPL